MSSACWQRTSVRLTASAGTQPLFLGLPSPGDVSAQLRDAPFTRLDGMMPILPDLPRVPLQLNGVGRAGRRVDPPGAAGPLSPGERCDGRRYAGLPVVSVVGSRVPSFEGTSPCAEGLVPSDQKFSPLRQNGQ